MFGMDIPYTMLSDEIKQLVGYKYYKHKKDESEKGEVVEEPKEQHVSTVRSRRGKGNMRLGNQEVNVPCKPKKVGVPKKPQTLAVSDNIIEESIADELAKSRQVEKDVEDTYVDEVGLKLKGVATEDPIVQSLLYLRRGSKESRLESLRKQLEEKDTNNEKDDETDDSNMDLSDDEPKGEDDTAGFRNSLQAKAKKLMEKAKHNMRKLTFRKVVEQKFQEDGFKAKAAVQNAPEQVP
ncbi:hypothetical protein Tco_0607153 [Tanacetum coccineum]